MYNLYLKQTLYFAIKKIATTHELKYTHSTLSVKRVGTDSRVTDDGMYKILHNVFYLGKGTNEC